VILCWAFLRLFVSATPLCSPSFSRDAHTTKHARARSLKIPAHSGPRTPHTEHDTPDTSHDTQHTTLCIRHMTRDTPCTTHHTRPPTHNAQAQHIQHHADQTKWLIPILEFNDCCEPLVHTSSGVNWNSPTHRLRSSNFATTTCGFPTCAGARRICQSGRVANSTWKSHHTTFRTTHSGGESQA